MYYDKVNFSIICFSNVNFSTASSQLQEDEVFQYMPKVATLCAVDDIAQSYVYKVIFLSSLEKLLTFCVITIYGLEDVAVCQG